MWSAALRSIRADSWARKSMHRKLFCLGFLSSISSLFPHQRGALETGSGAWKASSLAVCAYIYRSVGDGCERRIQMTRSLLLYQLYRTQISSTSLLNMLHTQPKHAQLQSSVSSINTFRKPNEKEIKIMLCLIAINKQYYIYIYIHTHP